MLNIRIKHSLPHRVRLKIPALRHCTETASRIEQIAEEVEGVHWARINPLCAGLVVRYDASLLDENEVVKLFMTQTSVGNA